MDQLGIVLAPKASVGSTITIDDEDRSAIGNMLETMGVNKIVSANDKETDHNAGSITPAAILLLEHAHHFLRWDGLVARDPMIINRILNDTSSIEKVDKTTKRSLLGDISGALKYSLQTETMMPSVVGLPEVTRSLVILFRDHKQLDLLFSALDWTIINTVDNIDVITNQHLPVEISSSSGYDPYLLEGMMVANILYPEISYRPGLNNIPLIARYDTRTRLDIPESGPRKDTMRFLVPGDNFSGKYLDDIRYSNKIREEKAQYYLTNYDMVINEEVLSVPKIAAIGFKSIEFLRGLLTLTSAVGISQPWIELEIKMWSGVVDNWIPAIVSQSETGLELMVQESNGGRWIPVVVSP